jgi:hypothetical protein
VKTLQKNNILSGHALISEHDDLIISAHVNVDEFQPFLPE